MLRPPAAADRFYPADPAALRSQLDSLIPPWKEEKRQTALAVISPHAGYVYSGSVAGETMARVRIPETVLILGPNHHGVGQPVALGTRDWDMPFGRVPIARELAVKILKNSTIIIDDDTAHQFEHSLEVQVPFLQYLRDNLKIVPIVISHLSFAECRETARDLVTGIRELGEEVLIVASTDMTHYEPRRIASKKDRLALERITALDPAGLYDTVIDNRISMCGIIPTTVALLAALKMGAMRAELVRYTDSGEAAGDTGQVVGYAGLIVA